MNLVKNGFDTMNGFSRKWIKHKNGFGRKMDFAGNGLNIKMDLVEKWIWQ